MNNTDTKIIKVHGKNIDNFFQNIITNDINNLNTENPIYTAMLSLKVNTCMIFLY